jgi:hypothetical protein
MPARPPGSLFFFFFFLKNNHAVRKRGTLIGKKKKKRKQETENTHATAPEHPRTETGPGTPPLRPFSSWLASASAWAPYCFFSLKRFGEDDEEKKRCGNRQKSKKKKKKTKFFSTKNQSYACFWIKATVNKIT